MNKEFLTKIEHRKAAQKWQKQCYMVQEKYRACKACRDSVRKVKTHPVAYGKRCERQQERLLQVYQQQKENLGKFGLTAEWDSGLADKHRESQGMQMLLLPQSSLIRAASRNSRYLKPV